MSRRCLITLVAGFCSSPASKVLQKAAPLLVFSLVFASCSPGYTEDSRSSVVKLRNDLIGFAKGDLQEIKGQTAPDESYILIYGYPERRLDSLPIPERLREKLERISSRVHDYEIYALARCSGDDIKEYTEWQSRKPEEDHPLLSPVPFMIRGNPFRVTADAREDWRVVMKIE